jgi:hypothetical protein
MPNKSKNRIELFEPPREMKHAMRETLSEIMLANQRATALKFISHENIFHYTHANSWRHPANGSDEIGEMETLSAEHTIHHDRIVNADMALLTESVLSISSQMSEGLTRRLYGKMNDACEKSGAIIRNKNPADSFIEMLERAEFSVNSKGEVEPPQLHVGDPNFLKALQEQPESFHAKIKKIRQKKSEQALAVEKHRKSKYKTQAR